MRKNNEKILLEILIPTYNREKDLKKNLLILSKYIIDNNLEEEVRILVSNNNSSDRTQEVLDKLSEELNIDLKPYKQLENIGLEKNALFVLEKASSEYVMYLGDDDFISNDYLSEIVRLLKEDKEISVIIPSIQPITVDGKLLPPGRDMDKKTAFYEKGFKSCLKNSWRGHQLSGVTFKREGVLTEYKNSEVNNIYPFIFFVAFNTLRGRTIHLTKFPVKVTAAPQNKKDWGYKNDGLISEIFDNYQKLKKINYFQRSFLELKLLIVQRYRWTMYSKKSYREVLKVIYTIESSKKTSGLTKIIFPGVSFFILLRKILRKT